MTTLPDLACACATLRRAARLVTQLYSLEMGRHMEPAQFALLSAMAAQPGLNQSRLGTALGLDKTTMSRNLRVLKANGWVKKSAPAEDRRESGYTLTSSGKKALTSAKPAWERAQANLRSHVKPGEWENMWKVLERVSAAALSARANAHENHPAPPHP